jgi:hypothetical protein
MSYKSEDEEVLSEATGKNLGKNTKILSSVSTDAEMRALLERWAAPDAPRSLDQRVMEAYRGQVSARGLRRLFASSIRVPLPIAALVVVLLLASALLFLRSARALPPQATANPGSPQVKTVEVPLIREKIVTRTIYLQKGRDSKRKLRWRARDEDFAVVPRDKSGQKPETSGEYFTRANLTGFQPLPQMTIEVIRRTKTDEN